MDINSKLAFEILESNKALDFAKYYDITEQAQQIQPHYKEFERIWICSDVNDFWLCRLAKNVRYNEDEGYINEDGHFVLERNNIRKDSKGQQIKGLVSLKYVLEQDDYSNYDCENASSVEEAEEMLLDYGETQILKWSDVFGGK